METLEELLDWLKAGGKIAIHDATNSTAERRCAIVDRIHRERGCDVDVVFIESLCTDAAVLEANVAMKLGGPDYVGMPPATARADFLARMRNYEKVYETIGDAEERLGYSYIKIENVGRKVIAHGIRGYLQSQCVFYLMQIHIKKRVIWLTRHGQSTDNEMDRIGGDAPLTELGARYADAVARLVKLQYAADQQRQQKQVQATGQTTAPASPPRPLNVWTSTMQRTMDTAAGFDADEFEVKHM
ncbi:hypothetical protein HK405_000872, partial [Cladochytrium tenue]